MNKPRIFTITLITLLIGVVGLTNCRQKKEDNTAQNLALLALLTPTPNELSGEITSDRTISGEIPMKGIVEVKEGATLTIEPGTVIKAETKSLLVVLPGAKIIARGTKENPIVFTSAKKEGERRPSDWGGVIIIGKAPIEAVPSAPVTEGERRYSYGPPGTNEPNDNSGVLEYVRIEFAGGIFDASGNDYNSLSMYAVGKGTTVQYIQTHMGRDDGVEIFGGRVEPKYLLITGMADDDLDVDTGYFGTITNVLGYKYPSKYNVSFSDDPRGVELDGVDSTQNARATFESRGGGVYIVENFTFVGAVESVTGGIRVPVSSNEVREGIIRNCAVVTLRFGQFFGYLRRFENPSNASGQSCPDISTGRTEITLQDVQVTAGTLAPETTARTHFFGTDNLNNTAERKINGSQCINGTGTPVCNDQNITQITNPASGNSTGTRPTSPPANSIFELVPRVYNESLQNYERAEFNLQKIRAFKVGNQQVDWTKDWTYWKHE
ncbi:MAG: hypothetical protein NZ853_00205 [Leptospiraceae bacterium]|nr:hypothetical protein [Leptospiraceae bacterium]MDW7976349.1 hypothetical protein [Leptospiraceae bacterium]